MGASTVSVILMPLHQGQNPASPRGERDALRRQALQSLDEQCPPQPDMQVLAPLRSGSLAAAATGDLLVFLGRGLDASSIFVAAHVAAHAEDDGQVVIGYVVHARPWTANFVAIEQRAWWEDHFYAMRRPGHRFAYDDLAGMNFSLPAALFQQLGGFDPTLADPVAQVLDLGVRAITAGARFVYAGQAVAYRRAEPSLSDVLAQDRRNGRVDAALARRHRVIRRSSLVDGLARGGPAPTGPAVARTAPAPFIAGLRPLLTSLERLRLREPWRRLYAILRRHAYRRGWHEGEPAGEIAVWRVPAALGAGASAPRVLDLDLLDGLALTERRLEASGPAGVRLRLGRQVLGEIPARPGAEPLRGVHLRAALASILAAPLAQAVQRSGRDGHLDGPPLRSSLPLASLLKELLS